MSPIAKALLRAAKRRAEDEYAMLMLSIAVKMQCGVAPGYRIWTMKGGAAWH